MKKIAIFASGSGSNAENIYQYFRGSKEISIVALICNKETAGVLTRFESTGVETILIKKSDLSSSELINKLKDIDLIVLAGFLLLIPEEFINAFPDKIINIHPSLLPNYGGAGMFGDKVHEAVLKNQETETGITIHLVNKEYDKGEILFQAKVSIDNNESLASVKAKIHALEHEFFPKIIENILV